jgi:hypothetical protein
VDHRDLARLGRPHQTMALRMRPTHADRQRKLAHHDAAKESNLPSRGLPGPASFEGRTLDSKSLWLRRFSPVDFVPSDSFLPSSGQSSGQSFGALGIRPATETPVSAVELGRYDGMVAQVAKTSISVDALRRAAAERMRGMFAEVAAGRSLVDELIADRRAEARAEGPQATPQRRPRGD